MKLKKLIAVMLTTLILACSVAVIASATAINDVEYYEGTQLTLVLGKDNANETFFLEQNGIVSTNKLLSDEAGTLELTIDSGGSARITSEKAVREMSAMKNEETEANAEEDEDAAPAESGENTDTTAKAEEETENEAEKQAAKKKQFVKRTVIFVIFLSLAIGYLVYDKFFSKAAKKKAAAKNSGGDDDEI